MMVVKGKLASWLLFPPTRSFTMSNQSDDSGEYGAFDILEMAERLKSLIRRNPRGASLSQTELANDMDMSQSTLSGILSGRPIAWKNHRKIIKWLQKTGHTAEDILWWQIGERRNPQMAAGGIAERRKVPRYAVNFPLVVTIEPDEPAPIPTKRPSRRRIAHWMALAVATPYFANKTAGGLYGLFYCMMLSI
jgi:transcriptional regulator with XRE-family HTH domain